jgi:hypothetical protein
MKKTKAGARTAAIQRQRFNAGSHRAKDLGLLFTAEDYIMRAQGRSDMNIVESVKENGRLMGA